MPDRRFIDLSHTVEHGMISYPGLPGPVICDYLSPAHRTPLTPRISATYQ